MELIKRDTMGEIPKILQLDVAGNPQKWLDYERYAYYASKDLIAWSMGEYEVVLHGGTNAKTGKQSTLLVNTIIAVKGKTKLKNPEFFNKVALNNTTLFRRDLNLCAYCGNEFPSSLLTRDHIHPVSRGGLNTWMNVVTACSECNLKKDARTPEEANMPLLYVPYEPNRAEYLILKEKHRILADQMEFLLTRVPKQSRLLS